MVKCIEWCMGYGCTGDLSDYMIEDFASVQKQTCGDPQNTFVPNETYPTQCAKMKDVEFRPMKILKTPFLIT